jgi:hypothetical protein
LVSSLVSGSRRPVALERTAGRRGRELEENNGKSAGTARSVTKNNSAGRGPGRQRETDQNPSHGAGGEENWPFRCASPPGRATAAGAATAKCQPPTIYARLGLRPGRIDGPGGAPIGRPRARSRRRPRVRCARLPLGCLLGTSEFCFAVAAAVLIERFIRGTVSVRRAP